MKIQVKQNGYNAHHLLVDGVVMGVVSPCNQRGTWKAQTIHMGCELRVLGRATIEEAGLALHRLILTSEDIGRGTGFAEAAPKLVELI